MTHMPPPTISPPLPAHLPRHAVTGRADRFHAATRIATGQLLEHVRAASPALLTYALLRIVGVSTLAVFAALANRDVLSLLGKYDGIWYVGIANRGYDAAIPVATDGALQTTNLAFFPLYPALIAFFDNVLPGGPRAAGLVIGWSAGLAAAWGLFALGRHLRDRRTGVLLAAVWAVLPHSIVQSMVYTETLLTALAVWSLYCVLRERWLTAGVLCLFAGLVRPTAAALVVAVGLAAGVAVWQGRSRWRAAAAAVLAPLGLVAYVAWVGWRLGRPDGYFYLQDAAWGTSFDGGAFTLAKLYEVLIKAQPLQFYAVTGVLALAILLAFLAAAQRVPWPLLVYAAVMIVMVIGAAGYYHAKARLLMPAFPLLLPIVAGLVAARAHTRVAVLSALTLVSAWYGVYLCLVWGYSP